MTLSKQVLKVGIILAIIATLFGATFFAFAQSSDSGSEIAQAESFVVEAASRSVARAATWDATAVYNGGQEVEWNGSIWRAKYWTQGNEPGTHEVWVWVSATEPTPTVVPPTPGLSSVEVKLRDVPVQVAPGAKIEITADFKNVSSAEISPANASITLPAGASLVTYDWNTTTQPVNGVGALLNYKDLPPVPPQVYTFGSDDFNNTVEQIQGHIKPLHELGLKMSANILAGALYFEAWNPDLTPFYGMSLIDYMKSKNYELSAHTYHHSHMGLDLHMNSKWIGESTRRYKRGSNWGIPNTEQEEKMEITLGKYWNEILFDRRMEGFRSPFLEFNIANGAESSTKTPLRSSKWGVLGKSGLRYACSVNEAPNPYQADDLAPSSVAENKLDARCAIPSWPALCDEETVAGNPTSAYTNATHQVHNVMVGTQRSTGDTGKQEWGTIFDGSLMETFTYKTSLNFMKKYVDRHYTTAQPEVPQAQITGEAGGLNIQRNIPVSLGLHASYTNNDLKYWKDENVKNNQWVYDITSHIKTNYPDAINVTHKDMLDYYLGQGTVRWIVTMPTTPGTYTFPITAPGGKTIEYTVQVKSHETLYSEVGQRVVKVSGAADVAGLKAQGYTDVLYVVKGATGTADIAGLDAVIAAAQADGLGVICEVSVFKDRDMHTQVSFDYAGVVAADIAEPTDVQYRKDLSTLLGTLSAKTGVTGIILDSEMPTDSYSGNTNGYSDEMVNHFIKYFGTPPAGTNTQDPTAENDPLYWSIYTAAATSDWRLNDIAWLYYDIRMMAQTYFNTGDMSNLGADANGVRVVDWLLTTMLDGSDNTGVSSWDQWEAWGEFRRNMIADFVNEVAGGATKPVYALVKGDKNAHMIQYNTMFGTNTDPVELSDPTRRPNILPDKWNGQKGQNLAGIIYKIEGKDVDHVAQCVDLGRKVNYWVAKGGNTNNGMMPKNEYRPTNDATVYGSYIDTSDYPAADIISLRNAGAAANGVAPAIVIVQDAPGPILKNVALGKPVYSSKDFASAYSKDKAVDGNDATVWGSGYATSGDQWIYVDLGKEYAIESVNLKWYDRYFAKTCQLGGSNDMKNWTLSPVITRTVPGTENVAAGGLKVRYIGVLCTAANDIAYGLAELEVMSFDN